MACRRVPAPGAIHLTPVPDFGYSPTLESRTDPPYLTGLAPTAYCRGHARIAQSVEHILGKDEVIGSIPIASFVALFHLSGFDLCSHCRSEPARCAGLGISWRASITLPCTSPPLF